MRFFTIVTLLLTSLAVHATSNHEEAAFNTIGKIDSVMERMSARCEGIDMNTMAPEQKSAMMKQVATQMKEACSSEELKLIQQTFNCIDENNICFDATQESDEALAKCGVTKAGFINNDISESCIATLQPQSAKDEL